MNKVAVRMQVTEKGTTVLVLATPGGVELRLDPGAAAILALELLQAAALVAAAVPPAREFSADRMEDLSP